MGFTKQGKELADVLVVWLQPCFNLLARADKYHIYMSPYLLLPNKTALLLSTPTALPGFVSSLAAPPLVGKAAFSV